MNTNKNTDYSIRSVEIVLDTLELILAAEEMNTTVSRLSSELGISKNKAYRLMSTLEKRGIVEKNPENGNYRLGLCALGLSQKIINSTNLIKFAHPVIQNLAHKHEEAVYLTVLKDDEVLFLDMADCDQRVKATALIGQSFPFFRTAAGKVIKAIESRDRDKLFKTRPSRNIDCDLDQLLSELEDIKKKGVAIDFNALGEGIISVAVAVKDYAGKVVGAITLLGPAFRLLGERIENEIAPSLLEGADMLSMKFGYAKY